MFDISNLNIAITRGDTATLEITFEGDIPTDGDTVVMALKTSPNKSECIWEKEATSFEEGVLRYDITTEDTADLPFGTYYWDLRIFYKDGQVTTPFSPKKFVVQEVVTNDREQEESDG